MKTSFLNFFRKCYANSFGEALLLPLVKNKDATSSFIGRLVPMPSLFAKPSWRVVDRNGLRLKLDISDMVDWYIYFDFKDPVLPFLISNLSEDSVMIDVGTNIGFVSLSCAKHLTHGRVYGFEPSTYNYQKCMKNISLNSVSNVEINQIGLGKTPSVLSLRSNDQSNHGMSHIDLLEQGDTEKITINTLDNFALSHGLTKMDLLKIDVEGFELQVLQGGTKSIQQFKPLIVLEVNENFLNRYGANCNQLFEWFGLMNYELFTLENKRITTVDFLLLKHQDIVAKPIT